MTKIEKHIDALSDVAADWRDPDHPQRAAAVEETLDAPNRWTEQALTHALNRWMQGVTVEGLRSWLGEGGPPEPVSVGILHADWGPLAGFRDALAVWALGHSYIGCVPDSSPALLPAFAEEVSERVGGLSVQFRVREEVYPEADLLLAQPTDETEPVHQACDDHNIAPRHRRVRPPLYSVGIVDGNESEDEMERLAEDMLLFEGLGRRRLAVLWAPADHAPDPYLRAMARFRGLFPAHSDTPGTLQMQQAFLEARDEPHAYANGLEFLVSRGEPEPQRPGHVRWAEYDARTDVEKWVAAHEDALYALIARSGLHDQLPVDVPVRTPGGVHIPPLDDEEGGEVVTFLRNPNA